MDFLLWKRNDFSRIHFTLVHSHESFLSTTKDYREAWHGPWFKELTRGSKCVCVCARARVCVCVHACVSVMGCTDTNEMGHALCWEEVQGDEGPRGGIEMLHYWHGARGWKGVVGMGFALRGKITLIAMWMSSQNCSKIEGYCSSPRKRWIKVLVQTEKSSWFKNCREVKTGGLLTRYYGEWGWGRCQDHTNILVWVTGWLVMLLDETWFLEEIRMGGLKRDGKIPVLWVWDALGSFKGRC